MTVLPQSDDAPTEFGKYRLLRKIAQGGMAEIHEASIDNASVNTTVVVKRILPELATQDQFNEMFFNEARIAVTLNHPNIVRTYDVGSVNGRLFIAMELLDGQKLFGSHTKSLEPRNHNPLVILSSRAH